MLFCVSVSVISVLSVFEGNVVCSVFHFESSPEWLVNGFSLLVAVISAVTAYISSNDKLFQNLDFWARYRVASEKPKSEYALYQGCCGDYDNPNDTEDSLVHTQAPDNVPGVYGDDNAPLSEEPAPEPESDDEFAEPSAEG